MTLVLNLEKREVEEWLRDRFLELKLDIEHPYRREDITVQLYAPGHAQISITTP
jgi:hypothetical protein